MPVEADSDRHCCGTWLHCGVRSRTPFGLASFARRDRTSRDVGPALFARASATNRLTDGTLVRRFEHTVTDITCEDLRGTAAADNERDTPIVAREGIHRASKHRAPVKRRQDRTLLMSLFEQGPQICQSRVDTFGDDVTVAEPAVAEFMTKLGKLYCEGGVDKCNLKQQRDGWLQAGKREDKSVVQSVFIRQPLVICTLNRCVFHDILHEVLWCSELTAVHPRQKAWASRASRPSAKSHLAKAPTLPRPLEGKTMSPDRKKRIDGCACV